MKLRNALLYVARHVLKRHKITKLKQTLNKFETLYVNTTATLLNILTH